MMLHQDGSTHTWVPGQEWDLILTMDDATSEQYSMFFVEEEGSKSSFQGVGSRWPWCEYTGVENSREGVSWGEVPAKPPDEP
jgi:hypothetical protein